MEKEISRKTLVGIIIVLAVIFVIAIGVIIFLSSNSNKKTKNVMLNNDVKEAEEKQEILESNSNAYEEIENMLSILNDDEYFNFQPDAEQMEEIIEFYNSSTDFNENILFEFIAQKGWAVRGTNIIDYDNLTMPNLVGMNYRDIREYLDNNNLYFIANINYKYENGIKDNNLLPTTILSTIPAAGTKLDSYTDTSITVLTDYAYGVKTLELEEFYEDFELKNFGKTMKIQFGTNEQGIIEGIIGQDFKTETRSGNKKIFMRNKLSWDTVKTKKCAYFLKEDMTSAKDHPGNGLRWDYVKGKIWIDNQLFKELTFSYSSGAVTIATWK